MGHYFINDSNLNSEKKSYEVTLLNNKFTFNTDNGVFCKKYLDYGTKILLTNLPYEEITGKVLDVGCGYGPIGIIVSKITKVNIHMVDINLMAIKLAKENARLNNINNALVYESNIYEKVSEKFDYIITNPPIRAGKEVVYNILLNAKYHLTNNGELWFVIRKEQGAKTLVKNLSDSYDINIVTKDKGYYIVRAKNK